MNNIYLLKSIDGYEMTNKHFTEAATYSPSVFHIIFVSCKQQEKEENTNCRYEEEQR